ncbi:MAG: DNA-directed RNA polymerase subunit K [Sulfolobales archaeon]
MSEKIVLARLKKLTKYELARVIAMRALQLSLGAPPLVNVNELNRRDPYSIALEEIRRKVLPVIIKRKLPNGVEYTFSLRELDVDLEGLDHV